MYVSLSCIHTYIVCISFAFICSYDHSTITCFNYVTVTHYTNCTCLASYHLCLSYTPYISIYVYVCNAISSFVCCKTQYWVHQAIFVVKTQHIYF